MEFEKIADWVILNKLGLSNRCPFLCVPVRQKKPKQGYHITYLAYRHLNFLLAISTFFLPFPFPSISPSSLMVCCHISDDLKEMALSMSLQGLSDSDIREYTGISERSLKRLRSTYCAVGAVSRKPLDTGRPRVLTAIEVKVRHNILRFIINLLALVSLWLRWTHPRCCPHWAANRAPGGIRCQDWCNSALLDPADSNVHRTPTPAAHDRGGFFYSHSRICFTRLISQDSAVYF